MEWNRIKQLFGTFLKIGAFSFGGGYAMIPLIEREIVEKKHWISQEEMLEVVAIAESTPGPIAINAATFVGYRTAGFWGSLAATLGVSLPSFIIIFVISYVLRAFENVQAVQYAFSGVRVGVVVLIGQALISMYKQSPKDVLSYGIMIGAFLLTQFTRINVIYVILLCALAGLAGTAWTKRGEQS